MTKHKILVIGAGISGLRVAQLLAKEMYEVTIIDKGRGVGGRMATRRFADTKVDHGAQYFSAKSEVFQKFLKEAEPKQIVTAWKVSNRSYPRYICPVGMSALPKYMSEGLNVILGQRVVRLEPNKAITESGEVFDFDKLVVTAPTPQVLSLLRASDIHIDSNTSSVLDSISYEPCWALMIKLNKKIPNLDGGIAFQNHSVSWVVDNSEKGLTTTPTITIHASAEFSREHLESSAEEVTKLLLSDLKDILKPEDIESTQIHRWRYSLAQNRASEPFVQLEALPIYIGGDGFGVGNVEGAFLSGQAIAEAILK